MEKAVIDSAAMKAQVPVSVKITGEASKFIEHYIPTDSTDVEPDLEYKIAMPGGAHE